MENPGLREYLLNTACVDKWLKIGFRKRAGVVFPLFSFYSKESAGIGDFQDLMLVIDWCEKTGNSILQLLPLNEVGSVFCPYDAISSHALEPAYISLLPFERNKKIKDRINKLKLSFPAGRPYVDYRIKQEKIRLLWDVYAEGKVCDSRDFTQFCDKNNYWIWDFALFKTLKEHHGGKAWNEWDGKYRNRDKKQLKAFQKEHKREISFHVWLQWQLYKQFKNAKKYAESKKILIKGDLPILVSFDSADVWMHPEFFKLDFAAGAPPDMYCAKGQRWGMPTYNWDNISADGYRYLKEKIKYAEEFYDILRIDHVVGLFRIWSIPYSQPQDNQGLNGFFDPADENQWRGHGKNILSIILSNTSMLLCAEDLGIIPRSCIETLGELGIPGNDVQRWVKDWSIRHDFLTPREYRRLSVAMLSTHDTPNWPAWWKYEAGTVDEALFIRKCGEREIDYNRIKEQLFDFGLSRHGRLRWQSNINSCEVLASILGKNRLELMDFIDIYENTYQEKEKLWRQLKLKGRVREGADCALIKAALKATFDSEAIFCVQLITDYLLIADIFKEDPYQYRINTPGTISPKNWSLTIPVPLEELLKHKANKEIRALISASGRI